LTTAPPQAYLKFFKSVLRSEWRDWVPPAHSALGYTSPKRFHELVARATVQRLQLACGLETEMYYSFDKVGATERESEREGGALQSR
jgi:hypothetical protein